MSDRVAVHEPAVGDAAQHDCVEGTRAVGERYGATRLHDERSDRASMCEVEGDEGLRLLAHELRERARGRELGRAQLGERGLRVGEDPQPQLLEQCLLGFDPTLERPD